MKFENMSNIVCNEFCDTRTETKDTRSLSGMITVLTESIKALNGKIETLEQENQLIKSELCKVGSYKFCGG